MSAFTPIRAISALILREMATTYGRTPGGYLWAVLEPLAAVALLATIFSLAFEAPPLGRSFALFYATGYLPFAFYSELAQKIGVSMRFSRPLLAYPALTWADVILARFVLNTLTNIGIITVVITSICIMTGLGPDSIFRCGLGVGLAALCGLAFGSLNAFLFEVLPIWERIWAILNRPAFIVSGVLFLPDSVPAPYGDWLWWNPLVHAISAFRSGVYSSYAPEELSLFYAACAPGSVLLLALILLTRHARSSLWLA
ncbi:MAG: ABC transporter permease [Pseudomonadota bacterium]|nr:ABC transporter permease [Pseudomonadota bacterium]